MSPVVLSLIVGAAATLVSLPGAVAVAWIIERSKAPGRGLLQVVVMLPLVLPPVVTGYLLLWLFSPRGWLGWTGVAFHTLGAVVAAAVVGFPLFVMNISLAMKAVDPRLETVARTLGCSRWQAFRRVTLPLAWPGILSGAVLAFARGLGEFGATIVLAGRIPGETETIPLAIYGLLDRVNRDHSLEWLVGASIAIAVACVFVSRAFDLRHRRRLGL